MIEEWKIIRGTNYSISSLGNLRFLGFKIIYGNGHITTKAISDIIPLVNSAGYKEYLIKDLNDKSIYHKSVPIPIHRLVAEAFITKPPDKNIVNHLDGNKLNNRWDNLEWTTISGNTLHAIQTGLHSKKIGFSNPRTILQKKDISIINDLVDQGQSYTDIEKELGFVKGYIRTKKSNGKRGIKKLNKLLKPDYTSPRFKNAHKDFVDLINKYIKEGYKNKEIESFLSLSDNYISEMRRLEKFKKFNILPSNKHKKLSPSMILEIKEEIKKGLTVKQFVIKYQVDRVLYYKIKNNI